MADQEPVADNTLQVLEQREVVFYGDELSAIRAADGQIYVSVRHLCDALGLDRASQSRRIRADEILSEGYQWGVMMTPHRGQQKAAVLRVDLVPFWLAGLDATRAKESIRPKLTQYKREVVKVLWEAFQSGRLTADVDFDALLAQETPEAQAYMMAQAVLQLARSQLLMRTQLANHEERLESIEAQLGDTGRYVTAEQASQISQAVKAVALAAGKKSGRNEFGAVYGELYRKFGITGYKLLPTRRFDEAMKYLTEWYQNLTGDLPF